MTIGSGLGCISIKPPKAKSPPLKDDATIANNKFFLSIFLKNNFKEIGCDNIEIIETAGHPIVYAEKIVSKTAPTVLVYGHYDVQPVDPIELWEKAPFDPYLAPGDISDVIYARGAADDKGQLMTFVEACRAWKNVHGKLPGKISIFFEGEEESSSPSLVPFMTSNAKELKADIGLICDTGLFGDDTPGIVTRLRGMLSEELTITGPSKDLHSGMYGGVSINPARVLSKVLAALHDESGRITIPNFYDGVGDLDSKIKTQWKELNFDYKEFLKKVGLSKLAGEQGKTALEMIWSQPTCEINGLWSGYIGDGFKTVLPSKASAKISFRLVGEQDPDVIRQSFYQFVKSMIPPDCSVEFKAHGSSAGSTMSIDDPIFEAARLALSEEWPNEAAFIGCGGSIPIAGHFKSILGIASIYVETKLSCPVCPKLKCPLLQE